MYGWKKTPKLLIFIWSPPLVVAAEKFQVDTDRFSFYLGSLKTIQNFTTLTVCAGASVNIRG